MESDDKILGFKWGHNFLEMNEGILDKYQQCKNSDEIREAEAKIKEEINSGRSDQEEWDPFDMENDGNINDRRKIEESSDDDSSGDEDEDEERDEKSKRIENENESSEAEEEDSSDDDLDNFNPY